MPEQVTNEERLASLESRVDFLEKQRPGRRMKPNVTSKEGVCGLDPERDSATCPEASIYRYQKGCQGKRCVEINKAYYAAYREKQRKESPTEVDLDQTALASS
jgi:hypothetical protein